MICLEEEHVDVADAHVVLVEDDVTEVDATAVVSHNGPNRGSPVHNWHFSIVPASLDGEIASDIDCAPPVFGIACERARDFDRVNVGRLERGAESGAAPYATLGGCREARRQGSGAEREIDEQERRHEAAKCE